MKHKKLNFNSYESYLKWLKYNWVHNKNVMGDKDFEIIFINGKKHKVNHSLKKKVKKYSNIPNKEIKKKINSFKTIKALFNFLEQERKRLKKDFLKTYWGCCQEIARKLYKLDKKKGDVISFHGVFRGNNNGSHLVYIKGKKVYDPMFENKIINLDDFIKKHKIKSFKNYTKQM